MMRAFNLAGTLVNLCTILDDGCVLMRQNLPPFGAAGLQESMVPAQMIFPCCQNWPLCQDDFSMLF